MADVQHYTEFTPQKRESFLKKLREGHTVTAAAKAVKVSRQTPYLHRGEDEDFATAWDQAVEEGAEVLEEEAFRRAVKGVKQERVVHSQGRVVKDDEGRTLKDVTTEYSDTLLIFLLKGRKPHVYRDNATVRHEGPNGGPIEIDDGGSDDQRTLRILGLLDSARTRAADSGGDQAPPPSADGGGAG